MEYRVRCLAQSVMVSSVRWSAHLTVAGVKKMTNVSRVAIIVTVSCASARVVNHAVSSRSTGLRSAHSVTSSARTSSAPAQDRSVCVPPTSPRNLPTNSLNPVVGLYGTNHELKERPLPELINFSVQKRFTTTFRLRHHNVTHSTTAILKHRHIV